MDISRLDSSASNPSATISERSDVRLWSKYAPILMIAAVILLFTLIQPVHADLKPQGELRIAVESLGNETLDPVMGPATNTKIYLPLIYDSLVGADKANSGISKETGVAKDWKISKDGKTYTFYLRQGIKFHNGDELTAEDVKFSFERAIGPKAVSSLSGVLAKIIDKITVVDPYTVTITLKEPSFSFLLDISILVGSESMIVPKKYIEKVGEEKFALEPIGSGPYRFKARHAGSSIEFEAMPHHWLVGVPRFANVSVMGVSEQGTRLTMLRSGHADVITIGRRYVDELKKQGFLIATKPASHNMHMLFNNQWEKDNPLNNKKVRQAIALAIDSQTILKTIMLNGGQLTRCWIADVAYDSRPSGLCDPQKYDPKAAKKLLQEAGYPDGIDITFKSFAKTGVPEKFEIDQAIAGYLRAVGIRAKIEVGEYGAYRTQWPKPESHPKTIATNPTSSQVVIGSLLQVFWGSDGLLSTTRNVSPKADKAIKHMLASPDLKAYKKRLMDAWKILIEDAHTVMLFSIDAKYAANKKKISKEWPMGTSTADPNLRALVSR